MSETKVSTDLRNVIWIIGAPTNTTFKRLKLELKQVENTDIVICASLKSYKETIEDIPVYVSKLPTNFRSHCDICTMGTTPVYNSGSFKIAQKETSTALANIFNYADNNQIRVFFANVDRKDRPTYLSQDTSGKIHPMNPFSASILNKLMDYNINRTMDLKLERNMTAACAHNGTYLADVLTVGCALLRETNVWQSYRLGATELKKGKFKKKGFLAGEIDVDYVHIELNEDADGLFQEFQTEKINTVVTALETVINNIGQTKHFGTSIVFHDALLNDIDDLPAIKLIESCSQQTVSIQNYSKKVNHMNKLPVALGLKIDQYLGYNSKHNYINKKISDVIKLRKDIMKRSGVRVPEDCKTLEGAVEMVHRDPELTKIFVGKGKYVIPDDLDLAFILGKRNHVKNNGRLVIPSAMNIVGDPNVDKSEIVVVGGIIVKKGIGTCHVEHLTIRKSKTNGVLARSSLTMKDVLVEQCTMNGVWSQGIVVRCEDVEVCKCGTNGMVAADGGSITLVGSKTAVYHNCKKSGSYGTSTSYGLKVSGSSITSIQLVYPLTKENVSYDNSGGGDCGASYGGDINQIKTIGVQTPETPETKVQFRF